MGQSARRVDGRARGGVAPILGEPDHPVCAALLSLLALDAALRFAGDEAVELAERACVVARRHDDWLRAGPWLAWLLSSLIANRHEIVMVAAREASREQSQKTTPSRSPSGTRELGLAHWMAGDIDEAQRLTEIGLALAEEIGAANLSCATRSRAACRSWFPELTLRSPWATSSEPCDSASVGRQCAHGAAAWGMFLSNLRQREPQHGRARSGARTELPTAMFLVDADGALEYYNEHAGIILGQPFDETCRSR